LQNEGFRSKSRHAARIEAEDSGQDLTIEAVHDGQINTIVMIALWQ
jgi:hypothetical protein